MPVPYQIVPQGSVFRPKIETHINDNTVVTPTYDAGGGSTSAVMCVFSSPKGRDRQVISITNGLSEFMTEYGLGPFSVYGQPLLNAYAAARAATTAGATVHCLRVTAEDAAYSTATVVAKYKVDPTTGMHVYFVVKPSDAPVTSLDDLSTACVIDGTVDPEGFTPVKLFTVAYRGRGEFGRNVRFRITNDKATDKNNQYKNYNFSVYRNETALEQAENFNVTFVSDAIYNNASVYAEDMLNDADTGSALLEMYVDAEGFKTLYDEYVTVVADTTLTLNDFDPLLGINKYTNLAIPQYTIDPISGVVPSAGETAIELSAMTANALVGGSDGAIAAGAVDRDTALDLLYRKAFAGEIDPNIVSKNRYPTTFVMDANFTPETKLALVNLVTKRSDCMGVLDCGLGITTKASVLPYFETNFDGVVDDWHFVIEGYGMKVRDPYSQKTVSVTSTYWMISNYLTHVDNWNGKQRPMAGNQYGIMDGFISNSVFPVFDEDLDSDLMDQLADAHVNIAKYNQNQVVVRSTQNTTQTALSALTEQNNVLILLDIKRDCERICSQIEYDFAEPTDIARFNTMLSSLSDKYSTSQVRSISASFDQNPWEAERSIIHLYVELVHRGLVKTSLIEIDVNRSDA